MATKKDSDDGLNLDFRNKTEVIIAVKRHMINNFSSLKKEIDVNIKNNKIKYNDSQLRNAKIEVDTKAKTVKLLVPVTKTGELTLDENLNVVSFE